MIPKLLQPIQSHLLTISVSIQNFIFTQKSNKNHDTAILLQLQKELETERQKNNQLEEAVLELKALLQIKESMLQDYNNVIPSEIIQTSYGRSERTFVLSDGTNKGISKNNTVVAPNGLVGKIINAQSSKSQVQLIVDRNSAVAGMVQSNRQQGIVYGNGTWDTLSMELETESKNISIGERVITSGLGGIFPKGLVIGRVKEINQNRYGLFQTLKIEPSVLFTSLEFAGVIQQIDATSDK